MPLKAHKHMYEDLQGFRADGSRYCIFCAKWIVPTRRGRVSEKAVRATAEKAVLR